MSLTGQLWRILTARQRRWVLAAQLASLLVAISTVTGIAAISPFFAVLADPGLIDRSVPLAWLFHHLGYPRHQFIAALGIGFVLVVLITNLISLAAWYALLRISLWIGNDLKLVLFREYLQRDFLFHVRTNRAALLNNIANETARVASAILQSYFVMITSVITAALIVVSIVLVNPLAALSVIAGLIGGYVAIYLAVRRRVLRLGQIEHELTAARTKLILETLGAIREIILLRGQQFFERQFQHSSAELSRTAAAIDASTHTPKHLMEFIAVGGLVAAALVLSDGSQGAGPWLAKLTFLGFAIYRLLPALQQTFAAILKIRAARPGFQAIADDLKQARSRTMIAAPAATSADRNADLGAGLRSGIVLRAVSFRYEAHLPPALREVSLEIPAGRITGLVGSNGSGKTTLADVLAGLLVPESGQILIDGQALGDAQRPQWQARIAYVPQNIFLLDATIAENIALATDAADIDRERLQHAVRLARLEELVATLPRGLFEPVGAGGVRLSGGQRQRLGIARALYRNAPVLILDEATNAFDVLAESEFMASLAAMRGQRTVVLIAHHLSSLRQCDTIVELQHGAIARSGGLTGLAAAR
jgi:HlyD family secretion protein